MPAARLFGPHTHVRTIDGPGRARTHGRSIDRARTAIWSTWCTRCRCRLQGGSRCASRSTTSTSTCHARPSTRSAWCLMYVPGEYKGARGRDAAGMWTRNKGSVEGCGRDVDKEQGERRRARASRGESAKPHPTPHPTRPPIPTPHPTQPHPTQPTDGENSSSSASCIHPRQAFFYHVFRILSLDNIVTIVEALILERTVVLYSSHLCLLGPGTSLVSKETQPVPSPSPSPFSETLRPHPLPSPFALNPSPSPFALTLRSHPLPSPFALTLHPHPSPSPFALTLRPQPFARNPSPATLRPQPFALTLRPHPLRCPLNHRLTIVAEVLLSLIYPMVWAGTFIPVLPVQLLPMLDSPSFGFFGIHASYRNESDPPAHVRVPGHALPEAHCQSNAGGGAGNVGRRRHRRWWSTWTRTRSAAARCSCSCPSGSGPSCSLS